MKVMILPIVISTFGTVTEGLIKGLEDLEIKGRVDTIQTTAWLKSARYWGDFWRLEGTCCHWNSSERPSADAVL